MRDETKIHICMMIGGPLLVPLGIVMHRGATHVPVGGWTAILGGVTFICGICGIVSTLWTRFRFPDEYKILPADVAERLIAIGENPDNYQEMVRRYGAHFVRSHTEGLEESSSLYLEWSPRLREFARSCRLADPCPTPPSLSPRDHAKVPIYEAMIQNAERLPYRSHDALICSMPAIAIPIAKRLWPGADDRSIFLTPHELEEWNTIYKPKDEALWCFTHYWWHVDDPPLPDNMWSEQIGERITDGNEPWLATSGIQWGELAGGEVAELWTWDGNTARSCGVIGDCQF